jgi:glycosyltransferase involved in cell wall biosynthesis
MLAGALLRSLTVSAAAAGMNGFVSFIVPVYNKLPHLRNCLLSLKHQSLPPDELVVSDDGSEDDVVPLLAAYRATVPFPITYVRQARQGFRAAKCRNNAARVAKGDYLVFCDQDLVLTTNYLQGFTAYRRPGRFLCADTIYLDEAQTLRLDDDTIAEASFGPLVTPAQVAYLAKRRRNERLYFWLRRLHLRYIGAKLRGGLFGLSASDLKTVNGFDEEYRDGGDEDDDLGFRLNAIGVVGQNPFPSDFALHQFHPPNYPRANPRLKDYYARRRREIKEGSFRCEHGLESPLGDDPLDVRTL